MNASDWYFDIHPTLTYNAALVMLEGGRGRGKTFSCKKTFLHSKPREETVWLSRTDSESVQVSKGFLSDLIKVYPDYEDRFELSWVNQTEDTLNEKKKKTKKVYPIIRDVVNQEVKIHFTSLNVPNKGIPFPNCRNLIFDEFLIKTGSSKRYLKDEVTLFFDIFQTIARLRKDFRCIMIANEIDPFNPYHAFFGIENIDKSREFTWIRKPDILFQWVQDKPQFIEKYKESAFHRVVKGSAYDAYMLGEQSLVTYNVKMKPVPDYARYSFNLLDDGHYLAVYVALGMLYLTDRGVDKSRTCYVPNLQQTGANRLYDAQIKGMIKKALGQGGVFVENKATRTRLMEWIQ